jgi:hypothetical protein
MRAFIPKGSEGEEQSYCLTVHRAGDLNICVGERDINAAKVTSMTNGRGNSRRSANNKVKQILFPEFKSSLISQDIDTGPGPGGNGPT